MINIYNILIISNWNIRTKEEVVSSLYHLYPSFLLNDLKNILKDILIKSPKQRKNENRQNFHYSLY